MSFDRVNAQFYVTNQRLIFFCEDYDKRAPMGCGFGAIGLAIVGISYLIRRSRAQARSRGLVLEGQIDHRRVSAISHDRNQILIGSNSPRSGKPLITYVGFRTAQEASNAHSVLQETGLGETPAADR